MQSLLSHLLNRWEWWQCSSRLHVLWHSHQAVISALTELFLVTVCVTPLRYKMTRGRRGGGGGVPCLAVMICRHARWRPWMTNMTWRTRKRGLGGSGVRHSLLLKGPFSRQCLARRWVASCTSWSQWVREPHCHAPSLNWNCLHISSLQGKNLMFRPHSH